MSFNNSNQNDKLVENLKTDITDIQEELNYAYYTINKLKTELDNKKKELLNVCSHPNKIRKREDGPYGERYWYCDKCKLEF